MGWQTGVISQLVIAGSPAGIFIYSPSAGAGNLIGSWSSAAGTDPYGNAYPAGIFVAEGMISGPVNITIGETGSSEISLNPQVNSSFDITTLIAGFIEAAAELSTTDANEVLPGFLGSLLLNTGTASKMSTVLTSPIGTGSGAAMILEAENDGNTDTPVITFGTVTTPDSSTEVFSPILTITPYALLLYGGQSGQVIVTKTSGTGSITGLPATVKAEAWGAGASLSGVSGGASAIGGCGSGGYSQEPALATAGSVTYSVPASANSLGGAPPDCTITGSAAIVTAHSGFGGTVSGFGNGAAASGNTVAFGGSRGGNPSFANPGGGGGGGGGAGPGGGGSHGDAGSPTGGGAAGTGATGSGNGGVGGNPNTNGGAGIAPGGGGGGGGTNADGRIGGGGQIRVTYSTGTPAILCSIASVAGTDQFGTNYPAGTALAGPGDGNLYPPGPLQLNATATPQTISSTGSTPITGCSCPVAVGTYRFHARIVFKGGAAAGTANFGFTGPTLSSPSINAMFIMSSGTAGVGAQISAASAVDSPTLTTSNSIADIWGQATFTAAGTLALTVAEGTTGDTVIIDQATMEVYPPT